MQNNTSIKNLDITFNNNDQAYWKNRGYDIDGEFIFQCSACGGKSYRDSRYCPDCGAYMQEAYNGLSKTF